MKRIILSIICLLFITSISHAQANGKLQMHFIDAGQADAAVLISPKGEVVMFDNGVPGKCTLPISYLQQLGVAKIDYHVASHYHNDHIGCTAEVLDQFPLQKTAYDRGTIPTSDATTTQAYTRYITAVGGKRKKAAVGEKIILDSSEATPVTIEFIALNGAGVSTTDENDLSLVAVIRFGTFDLVMGGDLSGFKDGSYEDIETLIANSVGKVEVYKVHHHGSAYSSNDYWLSVIRPKVGIISTGNGNSYHHPTVACIDRLHNAGVKTYWTESGAGAAASPGLDVVGGNIVVEKSASGNGFTVSYNSGSAVDSYTVWEATSPSLLYFPHVATNDGWQTEIGVVNTGSQAVAGSLKGYDNDGKLVQSKAVNLSGHGRRQVNVADEFTKHEDIGYMVFESTSTEPQGYVKFSQPHLYRTAIPATRDINTGDIYVTHIASNADWWTGISLVNTTAEAKNVTVEFNKSTAAQSGAQADAKDVEKATEIVQITLNPGQHYAFSPRSLFGNPRPDIESAVIKNADGVIGLELYGSAGWGVQLEGIPLTNKTATTIFYPHTASAPKSPEWWTGVVAYNTTDEKAELTIRPYDASGKALQTSTKDVEGKQKYVGSVSGLNLPEDTEWFYINSTKPISGFELFGTTDGQQLGAYAGGAGSTEGVFAKIEKQGWTGIAFVNIENEDATVILTAYKDDGTPVANNVRTIKPYEKVVNAAEALFSKDVSAATYIGFTSNKKVAGFQLNGSADWTMLDGLPALYRDYANMVITLDNPKWKTLVTGNQDRDGNGKLDVKDIAEGISEAGCFRVTTSASCSPVPDAASLEDHMKSSTETTLYMSFDGPNNKTEIGTQGATEPGYFEQIPADAMLEMLKVADKY